MIQLETLLKELQERNSFLNEQLPFLEWDTIEYNRVWGKITENESIIVKVQELIKKE